MLLQLIHTSQEKKYMAVIQQLTWRDLFTKIILYLLANSWVKPLRCLLYCSLHPKSESIVFSKKMEESSLNFSHKNGKKKSKRSNKVLKNLFTEWVIRSFWSLRTLHSGLCAYHAGREHSEHNGLEMQPSRDPWRWKEDKKRQRQAITWLLWIFFKVTPVKI